jgi:hypothetical protein
MFRWNNLPKLFLLVSFTLGLSSLAVAQHAAKDKPDTGKTPTAAADFSGLQDVLDAKTHKLRQPTPEEIKNLTDALEPMLNQTIDESKVQTSSDGTQAVFAGDRFANFILIRTNTDGTTSTRCVSSVKEAKEFLAGPTSKKNEPRRDATGLEVE